MPPTHPASDTAQVLPDPFLRLKAADIHCPAPVFVDAGDSVARAARAMAGARATACLVRDAGAGVAGILTERDVVVRVVAEDLDAQSLPVERVMTRGLLTVRADELLIEAFSRMVRHAVRRLVLLDAAGVPCGLLGEGDMLAARGESPLALAADIARAGDAPALARAFLRLKELAARSVAEGIGSEEVGRLISEMHDRIMSRAWGLALMAAEAADGPAPCAHAVLTLGSQGRREQFLATDQDLALVYAEAAHGEWFARLGRRLTELLLFLGFPPCPKRIMLDNPDWVRSRDAWLDLSDAAADRPDAEGVVRASLLADLRPLPVPPDGSGADAELGRELRASLCRRFASSAILLKCMAREAVRFSPPLGLFRGFALKKDGSLDVKRGGVFPITLGAKTLALRHGLLDETGTLARLHGLRREGALSASLAEGLCEASRLLQTLRMRGQAGALAAGRQPDNDIRPEELGAPERERLRQAFKQTAELQGVLQERFALHLMG